MQEYVPERKTGFDEDITDENILADSRYLVKNSGIWNKRLLGEAPYPTALVIDPVLWEDDIMHLVIIGGSDAGISVALKEKSSSPPIDVTILVANSFPNFSACGLSFFLSGEVADLRRAFAIDPQGRSPHTHNQKKSFLISRTVAPLDRS